MAVSVTYKVRNGFHVKGDVVAVAGRIEALKKKNATRDRPKGHVTPEEIVSDAEDESSPLHPNFTWDITEAARLQNLTEARYLLRSYYEVSVVRNDAKPIIVSPANVFIGKKDHGSYGKGRAAVSTYVAMNDKDYRRQVIEETSGLLAGVQARLNRLSNISPKIIALIEEARKLLEAEIRATAQ